MNNLPLNLSLNIECQPFKIYSYKTFTRCFAGHFPTKKLLGKLPRDKLTKPTSDAFAVLYANGSQTNQAAGVVGLARFQRTFSAAAERVGTRLKRADCARAVNISGAGRRVFRVINILCTKIGMRMTRIDVV